MSSGWHKADMGFRHQMTLSAEEVSRLAGGLFSGRFSRLK